MSLKATVPGGRGHVPGRCSPPGALSASLPHSLPPSQPPGGPAGLALRPTRSGGGGAAGAAPQLHGPGPERGLSAPLGSGTRRGTAPRCPAFAPSRVYLGRARLFPSAREGGERSCGQAFSERGLPVPALEPGPAGPAQGPGGPETTPPHPFTLPFAINCMKVSQSVLLINLCLFKLCLPKTQPHTSLCAEN